MVYVGLMGHVQIQKTVFDVCPKCGKKLTKEQEYLRDLTEEELKELDSIKKDENKRRNKERSSSSR